MHARDKRAAKRFFRKALKVTHNSSPRVINVDKNAAYPSAIAELKTEKTIDKSCKLRQNKYLNNLVEQDHRFIKRLVNLGLGFKSFHTARRTISGYEIMNQIRKGQILGIEKGGIQASIEFVSQIFGVAV
ncbi:MAG: IS6 family transposase ISAcma1 [Chroococcidiopsis cubana SAG 39.79]|nr:IS6 family transposase ISAcma1 [Chroococcidiopsis cubana SAG 39.79]